MIIDKLIGNITSGFLEDYNDLQEVISKKLRYKYIIDRENFNGNIFSFPNYKVRPYFIEKEFFSTNFFKKQKIDLYNDDLVCIEGFKDGVSVFGPIEGEARFVVPTLNAEVIKKGISEIDFHMLLSGTHRKEFLSKYLFDSDSEAIILIHSLLNMMTDNRAIIKSAFHPMYNNWKEKIKYVLEINRNANVKKYLNRFIDTIDVDYLYLAVICFLHSAEIKFSENYIVVFDSKFMDHKVYEFILTDRESREDY